jgi:hypothetical protein
MLKSAGIKFINLYVGFHVNWLIYYIIFWHYDRQINNIIFANYYMMMTTMMTKLMMIMI